MNLTHRLDRINRTITGWAITLPIAAQNLDQPTSNSGTTEIRTSPGTVLDSWCERCDRDLAICKQFGYDHKGRPIPTMSDPTGETVAAHAAATAALDQGVTAIETAVANLDRTIRRHLNLGNPTTDTNRIVPLGCELCSRVTLHNGHRLWEPPAYDNTTVKGILPNEYRLCRWCWDFTNEHGHKPSAAQCEAHSRGIKVTRSECANCPHIGLVVA